MDAIRLSPARGRKKRYFVLDGTVKLNATGNASMSQPTQLTLNFSYDGKRVSTAPSSNYEHYVTSLGRLQNTPLVVGGENPKSKKVEVLQSASWRELADFPFVDESINSYSMVTFKDALYLFGKFSFRFPN